MSQAQEADGEEDFSATTEQMLAALGVYITLMMWTIFFGCQRIPHFHRPFNAEVDVAAESNGMTQTYLGVADDAR